MKNTILLLCILSFTNILAQLSCLSEIMTDSINHKPVPFFTNSLTKNGEKAITTSSDFEREYVLLPIEPDVYSIEFTNIGYNLKVTEGVEVKLLLRVSPKTVICNKNEERDGSLKTNFKVIPIHCGSAISKEIGLTKCIEVNYEELTKISSCSSGSVLTIINREKVIGKTNIVKNDCPSSLMCINTLGISAQYQNRIESDRFLNEFKFVDELLND